MFCDLTLRRLRETIVVTYSESVFEALGIRHAMRMLPICICGLPGSTVFFHI